MNGLRRNDAEAPGEAGIQKTPLVSVVVLNWNGRDFLRQFLPFVLASTYTNLQVIVADNASTDDSVEFLRQYFPALRVIVNPLNEGFAGGYNMALRQVESDYYVLLNNDVEVTPGWIEPIIRLMENDASIAACQPKILDYRQRDRFEYAGACGGWLDRYGYPFARGRIFDITEQDKGQYEDAAPCFWASGAAMFVRSAVYQSSGGLDTHFFAHQEEIDLCWRLQLAGYKIYVEPHSVVYHVGGGTLSTGSDRKTFLNFRNNLVMLVKNLPAATAIPTIFIRMLLDATAAWKGLFNGDTGFFKSIFKAHVSFLKWILVGRKNGVFPTDRQGKTGGWYSGSVVWQHFIKKKNLFSEIVQGK